MARKLIIVNILQITVAEIYYKRRLFKWMNGWGSTHDALLLFLLKERNFHVGSFLCAIFSGLFCWGWEKIDKRRLKKEILIVFQGMSSGKIWVFAIHSSPSKFFSVKTVRTWSQKPCPGHCKVYNRCHSKFNTIFL